MRNKFSLPTKPFVIPTFSQSVTVFALSDRLPCYLLPAALGAVVICVLTQNNTHVFFISYFFSFCFIFHYSACFLELHQIQPSDMYLNMYVYIPNAKIPFSFRSEYLRQHFVLSSRIQFALYVWCIFADIPILVATRPKA